MKKNITRRDFLKMAGLMSLSLSVPQPLPLHLTDQPGAAKNVLIIVFDALTAFNISLYGYPRKTMPNLERLASRAIVYHNHFAGSIFTTPGTASLLTGTLPWTNRAFNMNETVDKAYAQKNIFHVLPGHYSMAYTHNPLAETLLRQFRRDIPGYIPQEKFYIIGNRLINYFFMNDPDTARLAWTRMVKKQDGYAYSLFLSYFYEQLVKMKTEHLQADFPRGFPYINVDNYFRLEDAIDWLENRLNDVPQPFLGYFHYLPPHSPYNTRSDFYHNFADDKYKPEKKTRSAFSNQKSQYYLNSQRTQYDEYILYVDEEFGRLYDFMDKNGVLDDTRIILTSDHGELFERGIVGHSTRVLYQPLVRIPLVIFEPGRNTREDVYSPTSAIDILPTLMHWDKQTIPSWCEGTVLPPYNPSQPDTNRSIFAVQVRNNKKYAPFQFASVMLAKGQYKLAYYFGYEELKDIGDFIELYDIQNDPEEMENLYPSRKKLGDELLAEVKTKLAEVNAPYL